MIFGIAGCRAGSSEFQKKIDDLQNRIAEMEDEISERDAIIEGLKEQIKKQEEKIEQQEKDSKILVHYHEPSLTEILKITSYTLY